VDAWSLPLPLAQLGRALPCLPALGLLGLLGGLGACSLEALPAATVPPTARCVPATVLDGTGAVTGFCDSLQARVALEERSGGAFPSPPAPPGGHWYLGPEGRALRDSPRAAGWTWYLLERPIPLKELRWQDLVDLKALGPATAAAIIRALGEDAREVYCGRKKAKGLGPVRLELLRRYFEADCGAVTSR
jgi:hypothetical protein